MYSEEGTQEVMWEIKKAKTDSDPMPENEEELKKRPEAFNLLNIFASITKTPLENIINDMAGKEFSLIKTKLSDVLVSEICPVGKEITKLMADQSYLKKILIKRMFRLSSII